MTRTKRALRAIGGGIAAAAYLVIIGIIAVQFGGEIAFLFTVSSLVSFFIYIGS